MHALAVGQVHFDFVKLAVKGFIDGIKAERIGDPRIFGGVVNRLGQIVGIYVGASATAAGELKHRVLICYADWATPTRGAPSHRCIVLRIADEAAGIDRIDGHVGVVEGAHGVGKLSGYESGRQTIAM